jgi:hypothetical protein
MEVTVSDEDRPDFSPFTLNMRLTSKESAHNLYKLLEPIIYALPGGVPISLSFDVNKEQRQMAEDICNKLSENVNDINNV